MGRDGAPVTGRAGRPGPVASAVTRRADRPRPGPRARRAAQPARLTSRIRGITFQGRPPAAADPVPDLFRRYGAWPVDAAAPAGRAGGDRQVDVPWPHRRPERVPRREGRLLPGRRTVRAAADVPGRRPLARRRRAPHRRGVRAVAAGRAVTGRPAFPRPGPAVAWKAPYDLAAYVLAGRREYAGRPGLRRPGARVAGVPGRHSGRCRLWFQRRRLRLVAAPPWREMAGALARNQAACRCPRWRRPCGDTLMAAIGLRREYPLREPGERTPARPAGAPIGTTTTHHACVVAYE